MVEAKLEIKTSVQVKRSMNGLDSSTIEKKWVSLESLKNWVAERRTKTHLLPLDYGFEVESLLKDLEEALK
ncbi:MAG: hypothetical protein Q8R15_00735 [Candidatus Micrarchaeota archaeon]|nr:hypothetical protein [Candidatus Micrarchaeota archaeon]